MTVPPLPRTFRSAAAFRAWLARHHARESEILLRCFKVSAVHRGVTYPQALDEALCFGWIDGVRRSFDAESFVTRFTPRRPGSKWSKVNIGHYRRLEAAGRVRPAGRAAFEARPAEHPVRYSFEERPTDLDPAFLRTFRANRDAWAYYQAQAPWYRRVSAFWVMSAKRPETRERRLARLMTDCAAQRPIKPLDRKPAKEPL
jgi:uncharacterized protein YdeI (YjbR/CyaY-like superfamily)